MSPQRTIEEILTSQAAQRGQAAALASIRGPVVSYQQLAQSAQTIQERLHGWGIGRGDRVAIVLPDGAAMALAFLGVTSTATAAPLNPAYRAAEFQFLFDDLKPKALIVDDPSNPAVAVAETLNIRVIPASITDVAAAGFSRTPLVSGELPDAQDVALILHTSGTTSRPKRVSLTQANLCASAYHIARWLELKPDDCCLNVMPLFHIHGLVAALLASLASGGRMACSPGFIATDFFDWFRLVKPTWYTAVPTMHQAIVARGEADPSRVKESALRFVRSSSAALSPKLAERLQNLFDVPVIEAYGMTEAAHQMCSNPRAAGQQRFGSVGLPAGPQVAIMNQAGELLAQGESGEVVIRGENVTAGYIANPDANARAFASGWFRTGDLGWFDRDGYLHLSGRIKEIINRGGEKISPREIDEVLLDHPAVAEALAFALADSRLGEEVAAAVVLRPGHQPTERELVDFVTQRLADFKVPRRIIILDAIPKGPTGKLQRIGMANRLGLQNGEPKLARERVEPQTQMEIALAAIWRTVLKIDAVGGNDNFFNLGGDSILAAQVIARVRQQCGREMSVVSFFQSPTLAEMAAAIERTADAAPAQFERLNRSVDVPATPAQRRLWFLDQMDPRSAVYNNAHAFRLNGPLLVPALRASVQKLVDRHDVLRMRFESLDGQPFIRAAQAIELPLPLEDLSQLPPEVREHHANRLMSELASKPFDLSSGPLLRLHLLKLSDGEHILVYVVHHIASDRWSLGIFARELLAFYDAERLNKPSPLRNPPISYLDYAALQSRSPRPKSLQSSLDYWRSHLGPGLIAIELPLDQTRPAIQTTRGDTHRFNVPQPLTVALQNLGRAHGATLNMVLLAAFEALLFRYTNQEDALLGTALAGRDSVELEGLIGLFVNVLPVRCRIRSDMHFTDLLARTKSDAIEMLNHQAVPFDKLVECLGVARDSSRPPLFQVVFNFHNVPATPNGNSELRLTVDDIPTGTSRFDLHLYLQPGQDGLTARMEYGSDLFEPEMIRQIAENFVMLLQGIVADPTGAVGKLPMLTPSQRHQLLVEWNGTGSDVVPDECLVQMFERQVRLRPDALALIAGPERLTYRQLNKRANQLAHHLRSLGVGAESLVALCLPRTARLLVAVMGVLKSGGAYVPLDPSYPASRLAHILEDSHAAVLITEDGLAHALPIAPPRVVCFDRDEAALAGRSTENLVQLSGPQNLAYVIYTSGSTGNPKGVAVEQANVAAFVNATRAFVPDRHLAGVLCAASVCFDLSVFEIFVPLCRGGAVILAANGLELRRCAGADEVTCAYLVPSVMAEVLHIGGLPQSLRVLLLGGEVVSESLARRSLSLPGIESVYDLYGPTEDTVSSTGFRVPPDIVGAPPIGRPFGGTRTYILDAHRQPVPRGASGELYLGGAQVARGYLGRPELTAEKFVPDPFGPPGSRIYATGDLCRYRRDGNIQYIGRIDHQIKLRGYRIELGEIDAVLGRHPDIRQCCTTVSGDGGDAVLVAYLTVVDTRSPAVSELRRHVAACLPEYMIPSRFFFLASMPMDPSGKIDRKALPLVDTASQSLEVEWCPPTTPLQKQLATIWSDVLCVARIGLNDNFFLLGGHSLRVVTAVGRIAQAIGIEVPVRMFFERPTLAALAEAIESRRDALPANPAGPARPLTAREDRRLSHGQQRIWFQHRLAQNSGLYNVVTAQRLMGPLDGAKLERALGEVIARHESLRTSFPDTDGVPWPAIVPARVARVKISTVDCSSQPAAAREAEVERIFLAETQTPFDLARWPLMRAWLIRTSVDEHVFVLTMHHIICDDWSLRILFDEISHIFSGAPPLPPLPAQYDDFAAWLDDWTTTPGFQQELNYWKSQLAGAPPVLEVPTDRPRPRVQSFAGSRQSFQLDRQLTQDLHALAQAEGGTVFMSLLAAFSALLMRATGQTDIVIGSPIANRRRPEFQPLIGLFLNMLPLRVKLDNDLTFRQLFRRARDTALDAFTHQTLPFEMIIDRLYQRRNPQYAPVFQVVLVHLGEGPPRLHLPDIRSESSRNVDGDGSKFDLTLYFDEQDGLTDGAMDYNTDLFDRSTVRILLDHLVLLLRTVVASPDAPLGRLPIPNLIAAPQSHNGSQNGSHNGSHNGARMQAITADPEAAIVLAPHAITPTEQTLMDIWQEILGISPIRVSDNFFELGGISFSAVRVFSQIERRLGTPLPMATIFLAPTIAQLARRIDAGETKVSTELHDVIQLRSGGDGVPVFCLSGSGGQVFPFQKLAGALEANCAIYGLQFDNSGPESMEDIAASFLERMRRIQPDGPRRMIGYSFGGALAFEIAQQLTRAGEVVELLVFIDAFVPGSSRSKPLLGRMAVHFKRLTSGGIRGAFDHAARIAQSLHRRLLPHRIRTRQTILNQPSTLEEELQQIEGANRTAFRNYQPVPYKGDVVLFSATAKDPWRDFYTDDAHLHGWMPLVLGKFTVHSIPGTHYTLFDEPHVRTLARQLNGYLDRPAKKALDMRR